jgi:sugar O-acyltransferase (sialic acid O-acetyltransferase NeuD family)
MLGASGHAKVVAEAADLAGWDRVYLFDDRWPELSALGPWSVAGTTSMLLEQVREYEGAVVAIGASDVRLRLQRQLEAAGATMAVITHPSAVVSRLATLGLGTVVLAGAIVNPFASIATSCIVNTGASIDHDCVLASGVHVSPGARLGGGVRVGEGSWIGIGASVKQGIVIGVGVTVGAGAAVVADVADHLTVIGVPARPRPC